VDETKKKKSVQSEIIVFDVSHEFNFDLVKARRDRLISQAALVFCEKLPPPSPQLLINKRRAEIANEAAAVQLDWFWLSLALCSQPMTNCLW